MPFPVADKGIPQDPAQVAAAQPTRASKGRTLSRGSEALVAGGNLVLIGFIWWLVTQFGFVKPLFLPAPSAVWDAFTSTLTNGYRGVPLWEHLGVSLRRVAIGFGLALVVGTPLGILVGTRRMVQVIIEPIINFYRPLPPLAYYTLLIVWLGIGEASKVTLLFLAGLPPIFIATIGGVNAVRTEQINAARSLGAGGFRILRYVVLPASLPDIFTGMRVSIAATYTTVVAAELVAAEAGIGWVALDAARFLQTNVVFMAIIIIGVTGMMLDSIIKLFERRLVPWVGKG